MSARAQALRANSSPVERRMWRLLWSLRTGGYHFRKQAAIGPYVVDFACHHAFLVIEVDGETHFTEEARRRDAVRDRFLRDEGYRVLRFTNLDVMGNPDGVFEVVSAALADRPTSRRGGHPLPNPPHKGEGSRSGAVRERGRASDQNGVSISQEPPDGTSPLVGEVGRGVPHPRSLSGGHPLPDPPHKGEGVRPGVLRGRGLQSDVDATPDLPRPQDGTSPLVGEAGRGGGLTPISPVAHPLPDPPHRGEGGRPGVLRERGPRR